MKKTTTTQWRWFAGLYLASLIGYGAVELCLHYLNALLLRL